MNESAIPAEERQRELLRKVRRIQIRTAGLIRDLFAGQYHSAFKGLGMVFSEVREYVPGDDIRSIDWNVTARMNGPYVKHFVEERELTLMLLVDLSRSGQFGSGEKSKIDLATELAAILAFSAIQNNDRVGLLLFTDRVELYVPPRKGTGHVLRIIRDLLFFEPAGRKTSIRAALDFLNLVMRRRAAVFLISDFKTPKLDSSFAITAKQHDLIPVQIMDPFEEKWPRMGLVELEDMETGERVLFDTSSKRSNEILAAAYKKNQDDLKKIFRSFNLDDLAFRTDQSVVQPLRQFFRVRRHRKLR